MQDPTTDPDPRTHPTHSGPTHAGTATRERLHEQPQSGWYAYAHADLAAEAAASSERPARHHARRRDACRSVLRRFERDDRNVGDVERWTSVAAGALLAGLGIARRDVTGALVGLAGGALLYRGATGSCPLYRSLGVDTSDGHGLRHRRRRGGTGHEVEVTQAFTIDRPADELYRFWRNFENLPQVMAHLESVRQGGDGRSHWVVRAPRIAGGKVEWDAEITRDDPGAVIAWRSLPGADVENQGSVRFESGPRGTVVRIRMSYRAPGGRVGKWAAKVFGSDPETVIREDLRNFKRVMETGDILTTRGQPRGTCLGRGQREGTGLEGKSTDANERTDLHESRSDSRSGGEEWQR